MVNFLQNAYNWHPIKHSFISGLVQDYSNSIANTGVTAVLH